MLKKVVNSNTYKIVELRYWNEIYYEDYWIYYCIKCDHLGLSRDMVVKEHTDDMPFEEKSFTHHCPKCDGFVLDPNESVIL